MRLFTNLIMSHKNRVERRTKSNSFLLQVVQRQSEHMNVMFREIRDRFKMQDITIANLQRGHSPQVPNT